MVLGLGLLGTVAAVVAGVFVLAGVVGFMAGLYVLKRAGDALLDSDYTVPMVAVCGLVMLYKRLG